MVFRKIIDKIDKDDFTKRLSVNLLFTLLSPVSSSQGVVRPSYDLEDACSHAKDGGLGV